MSLLSASALPPSPLLRRVLLADAVVTGLTGLGLALGSGLLAPVFGLPPTLLLYVGLSLLPFAALVAVVGTRQYPSRPAVGAVIVYNVLWALDSVVLLLTPWVEPTGLGVAFVLAQAVVVAVFAELQYLGLRRSGAMR